MRGDVQLAGLRSAIAAVAQDAFAGFTGWPRGACRTIAEAIAEFLVDQFPAAYVAAETEDDGASWYVVLGLDADTWLGVEIDWHVYETVRGGRHRPRRGVVIGPRDVAIGEIPAPFDAEELLGGA